MSQSSIRLALVAVVAVFAFAGPAGAAAVELIRVWPGWRDASEFERIGEFFGLAPHESRGKEIVLRTHPADRSGFYFLVRLKSPVAMSTAKFELGIIRPDTLKPLTFEFPAELRKGETVYQLGLTGPAWPDGKEAHPVAWKLALLAPDGSVLAEQKSFLWEKPAH